MLRWESGALLLVQYILRWSWNQIFWMKLPSRFGCNHTFGYIQFLPSAASCESHSSSKILQRRRRNNTGGCLWSRPLTWRYSKVRTSSHWFAVLSIQWTDVTRLSVPRLFFLFIDKQLTNYLKAWWWRCAVLAMQKATLKWSKCVFPACLLKRRNLLLQVASKRGFHLVLQRNTWLSCPAWISDRPTINYFMWACWLIIWRANW